MAKKVARKGKKKLSRKYASFSGRMVMIGFGSIGKGTLPLIERHFDVVAVRRPVPWTMVLCRPRHT